MKEQVKQEAKERVAEYRNHKVDCAITSKTTIPLSLRDEQAKAYAIIGIQNEIDLLEKLAFSENRIRNVSAFKILNTKLNNLKQVKTEIEKL